MRIKILVDSDPGAAESILADAIARSVPSAEVLIESRSAPRDIASGDVVVDISARAEPLVVERHTRCVELWCDGLPSTLAFTQLAFDRRRGEREIVWTIRNGDEPRAVLQRSTILWIPPSSTPNQTRAAARATALLVRALKHNLDSAEGEPWQKSGPTRRPSGFLRTRAAVSNFVSRAFGAVRRVWSRQDVWFIAYRPRSKDPSAILPKAPAFRPWGTDRQRFVADPCAIQHAGTTYMFYEDYIYSKGKGEIAWSALSPDGTLTAGRPALECDYHLSYPFVFEFASKMYMIPESAQASRVDLFRAEHFPDTWVFESTLLADINAVDATLHFDGERWWMFTAVGEFGSSTWDELFLYYADTPLGPWTPHARNPVKTGYRSSRPAGRLFERNGRLFRPAQDCSTGYGMAIRICEIDRLDADDFVEHEVDLIDASWLSGASGIHTLCITPDIEVVDGKWERAWRWRGT